MKYRNKVAVMTQDMIKANIMRQQQRRIKDLLNAGDKAIYNKDDLNHNLFRSLCYSYITKMREVPLPPVVEASIADKNAVFIEFRVLNHIEFLIRNTIRHLGEGWAHTIVCGMKNYNFVKEICDSISPNINVIRLPIHNLERKQYSDFLLSLTFWNLFTNDKILIYQEDSCIFNDNIDDFMEYDYIGAPFDNKRAKLSVGNGGFSLRTRKCMIDAINQKPLWDPSEFVTSKKRLEDVFFSKTIQDMKIGQVAPWEDAYQFSTEAYKNTDSLGGHQFWKNDRKWMDRIVDMMKPYYEQIEHPSFITLHTLPHLFHKYLLGMREEDNSIQYDVVKPHSISRKEICSIHCYNLNQFHLMFSQYMNYLYEHFDFIVTYCVDIEETSETIDSEKKKPSIYELPFTFIKIPNYGMDIGNKFVVVDYLKELKYDYNYLFFIHSKTNTIKRNQYMLPYLTHLQQIKRQLTTDDNIGAVFNSSWIFGDEIVPENTNFSHLLTNTHVSIKNDVSWNDNHLYVSELSEYLELPTKEYLFNEGNFYILHKNIAEKLFGDRKLYNILNDSKSFDYQWVSSNYKIYNDLYSVYKLHNKNKDIVGNYMSSNMVHKQSSDNMIEHSFERIIFNYVKHKTELPILVASKKGIFTYHNNNNDHNNNNNNINNNINNVNK
tara:strand:- start:3135 stop:5117 length:1983 start_codon:yes stop_codon:yes gene_type:complete